MKNTHNALTNWDAVADHVDEKVTAIQCMQRYNKKRVRTVDKQKEKVMTLILNNSVIYYLTSAYMMIIFAIRMIMISEIDSLEI